MLFVYHTCDSETIIYLEFMKGSWKISYKHRGSGSVDDGSLSYANLENNKKICILYRVKLEIE